MLYKKGGSDKTMAFTKNLKLNSKSAFITGATGCIGSRLVEHLFLKYDQNPVCLVHNPAHMARIARFQIDPVFGNVLLPETFAKKISKCDVIIHAAFGKESDQEKNWEINVQGTENLLKLAVENKIKHFIFISSAAVYEEEYSDGILDETITPVCPLRNYAGGKLRAEQLCLEYWRKYDLPITILRPSIVYGPFMRSGTIAPYVNIKKGTLRKYIDFNGICNLVYIEDVVSIIFECICNESAFGEIFNVAGEDNTTWNEVFDFYSELAIGKPLPKASYQNYMLRYFVNSNSKKVGKWMVSTMPELTKSIYGVLKNKGIKAVDYVVKVREFSPQELKFFTKTIVYPVDKLKEKLGYKYKFPFEKGSLLTAEWLKSCSY